MQRMKLRLPWVTLTGTPDAPGRWSKVKCFGAMLAHEAVELTAGTERAHAMATCRRYAVEAVVAAVAGEVAAGAAEAGAAGAAEAGAAGGGVAEGGGMAAEEGAAAEGGGQMRNLSQGQFGGGAQMQGGGKGQAPTTPKVGGNPRSMDDPGYTS